MAIFGRPTKSKEDIVIKEVGLKNYPSDSASGPDGIPAILLKNCAEELAYPIKLILALLLCSKKGDRARAVNYRPVALTSHVIKIYERIHRNVMVEFIEENQILCDNQHGFRSGRGCLTQLLSHGYDIVQGLSNGVDTDAIYLDFVKAFDKVDHRLLLLKMNKLGFHERLTKVEPNKIWQDHKPRDYSQAVRVVLTLLYLIGSYYKWVESFLSKRQESVVVDGVSSFEMPMQSGVPQGTVLGPLYHIPLFIIFINDMSLV